ncbi:hypothetical protein PRZ48_013424 [Zasmidium cellare]|uniref:Uncharacterized protein n=1 Tax=Zasmidium cellare TaxID=395010 RepID=A0ABR0E0Z4_ZASCE|nr:hypothetical protein PRZ48_013424 [Zasmidium cellare]
MLNGFFRSWVFAPEEVVSRNVVRVTGRNFTKLSGLPEQTPPPILFSGQLSESSLPPLYTLLIGAFQIVDIWQTKADDNECGVDFAYGWNTGTFAGCHRLSVTTLQEGGASYLRLTLACLSCNPMDDGRRSWVETLGFLSVFHKVYAEVLFRAVVGDVVTKLEASGARVHPVADHE